MKKYVLQLMVLFLLVSGVFSPSILIAQNTGFLEDKEYIEAVTRMYDQQMTKYVDPLAFRPDDLLTRQEAAKFFVGYATKVTLKTIDTSRYCSFDDIDEADPTLRNDILQSCLLRLFKGNQGAFFPQELLTKAQALTVLLRITETDPLDESGNPWWLRVYDIAKAKGYTKETQVEALDRPVTRYELALLLYRVSGVGMHQDDTQPSSLLQNNTQECDWLKNDFPSFEYTTVTGDTIVLVYPKNESVVEKIQEAGYTLLVRKVTNGAGNQLITAEGEDRIALLNIVARYNGFSLEHCEVDSDGFLVDVGGQKPSERTCAVGNIEQKGTTYTYVANMKTMSGGDASLSYCVMDK